MATLKYSIPGIGGSLGMCAVCGESFATEILLGKAVAGVRVSGIEQSLPVHDKCGESLAALQGPWEEIRDKFPKGPMFDCFEEESRTQKDDICPTCGQAIISNEHRCPDDMPEDDSWSGGFAPNH